MTTTPRAVIVGSGVAGLTTALALGDCVVVTKTRLGAGSSVMAQGGVAAAVGADDDPDFHARDTLAVSAGLADPVIADIVTAAAPERIDWLVSLGAAFDRAPDGSLVLGREAGHGMHRIVHANGDATGAELIRTLRTAVRRRSDIDVLEDTYAVDLVTSRDRTVGVFLVEPAGDHDVLVAPAIVLATGGIGRVYSATTNPVDVTGDGLAMAARAGARLADPELVQFHPTAMRSTLDPMPLLTEALRGAGAVLRNDAGERFMVTVHRDADLAPRDVVAREIWRRARSGDRPVLDATHLGASFPERFPTVFAAAMRAGFDPRIEGVPVSPAQHYHMGGIAVDDLGRSSLPGLYVCGEASMTGLNGANRLASNSLLEGLVFGARIAGAIRAEPPGPPPRELSVPRSAPVVGLHPSGETVGRLREIMWDRVGVVRDASGLRSALDEISALEPTLCEDVTGRNLIAVARFVTEAALERVESRGGHFRLDHPNSVPEWSRHTIVEPTPERSAPVVGALRGAA